jgi:hypothetical protein
MFNNSIGAFCTFFLFRHEIAEIAGVISISCYNGQGTEKHVVLFKRDNCPSEEELKRRRLGEVSSVF